MNKGSIVMINIELFLYDLLIRPNINNLINIVKIIYEFFEKFS